MYAPLDGGAARRARARVSRSRAASAEDRLFLMDLLRHTGRAELSSFAGGAEGNRAMDRTQWLIAPYTEADLEAQIQNAPAMYGAAGARAIEDGREFVAGINAYINAA